MSEKQILPLPLTAKEMTDRGWKQPDVVLVTGDAYVDHPSFGVALVGRYLESLGYRVVILSQPDWRTVESFRIFGQPRLFWGITSGCIDSRLNQYASMGHKRKEDLYSPGGVVGLRPDRPLLVYAARAREAYKNIPIVLGGLEASLRRLVHYDYIEDRIKRSILIDAKADILVHGMGETAIAQIAARLAEGKTIDDLTDIAGIAYRVIRDLKKPDNAILLPSFEEIEHQKSLFMDAQLAYQKVAHPGSQPVFQEQNPGSIVVNPPANPLSSEQLDRSYILPFTRQCHPIYDKRGGVPALAPVQTSVVTHRGCFGGCNFCSIFFHQGKQIQSRSIDSVLSEISVISQQKGFRGTISDIGGPTANMYGMACSRNTPCDKTSCLSPKICPHLRTQSPAQLKLLDAVLRLQGAKKFRAYIASGVRHDLALHDKDYMMLLARHFTGGHLKVAPEHYCPHVLDLMGKPDFGLFEEFESRFADISRKAGKEQYLVPYFISGHPGCSSDDALKLTDYLLNRNWQVRQVQDFVPIPLTMSAAMYVSGMSPRKKTIFIPRGHSEKKLQIALLQYHQPQNAKLLANYLSSRNMHKLLSRIRHIQSLNRQKGR